MQAGFGFGAATGNNTHALLWVGTAASVIDLNPLTASSSNARAIAGSQQAGYAAIGGNFHAAIWSGTAASFVDLAQSGARVFDSAIA